MLNILYWKVIGLFVLGHTFTWFQLNAQFMSDWWKDKPVLAVVAFGIPAGLLFMTGWNIAAQESGEVWMPRFLGFCASWVPFPLLTWALLGETPFTWRTITCFLLACCIMVIQLWR